MTSSDILLVASDRRVLDTLSEPLAQCTSATVRPLSRVIDALAKVAQEPCRSAVCVVESAEELACVIRIKKARPDLPVVMLTPSEDATLHALGQQMGADAVVRPAPEPRKTAELLALALETKRNARNLHREIARSEALVNDLQRIGERTRDLIQRAMGLAASVQPGDFVTLVVEDDPTDVLLLVQALRKAGLPPLVRTCKGVSQAIDYLSGRLGYADRGAYPLPSLIISDLNLGPERGMDLLRWVRSEPSLAHLGFILFTSSDNPADIEEATRLRANFYILKRLRNDGLVDVVRSVYEHSRRYRAP